MNRTLISLLFILSTLCGCQFSGRDLPEARFPATALDGLIEQAQLEPSQPTISEPPSYELFEHGPLDDFNFANADDFMRLTLAECIQTALQDSPVIRDLGGLILRAPDVVPTMQDPSLAYSDPRFGEDAALSEFDAAFRSQLLFQKNDRFFNNQFIGNAGASQQDLAGLRTGLSKQSATGAQFQFNHVLDYDFNNSPSNRFNDPFAGDAADVRSYAYDLFFEGSIRQPLLQGAGATFNRIAGPNNAAGIYRGVLIARANTDIALADFETRVRDLISDVENAYWDLYFAYRDLEAKIEARNGAYDIWQNVEANKGEKSAAIIGQAKEQYYRFAADVEDAIHGRPIEGTRTNNGSSSGTFRRSGGVRVAERRLRLIIGMNLNDRQLIVPDDMPIDVSSVFDWQQARTDALTFRPELRRQRWKLKRSELERLASKNHLLPRLDVLGKYRFRGFGHNLFGDEALNVNDEFNEQINSSAYGTLLGGNLQEWELGLDMSVPIGFRQQYAALRNAELRVAREAALLKEQERQVIYGLSNAIGEIVRTNRVRAANYNRLEAAKEQYSAIQNIWREQDTTIDLVLEAQRRVIESKIQYFQTQVEMMLAIKSVHFEKGTLFQYHNVRLAEADSHPTAQLQALDSQRRRRQALNYFVPGLMIGRPTEIRDADDSISNNLELENVVAGSILNDTETELDGDRAAETGAWEPPHQAPSGRAAAPPLFHFGDQPPSSSARN
jgi:outer membrane protein TolC